MTDPVIAWLLEDQDPSVRYRTLTDLLGEPADDPRVLDAKESIMQRGLVPKILVRQNPDGSWEKPEDFYLAKYMGAVWNLILLAELGADPADPRIQAACEFILRNSQNPVSGGFAFKGSARGEGGLASSVVPCLTGNMVSSLIRLGCLDDSRVRKAIDWIVTWQRADDGDGHPDDPYYKRYDMCWGRHSCHMGVAKALKALADIPPDRRSRVVSDKIGELAEYFLIHHLYKKSHNLAEVSKPGWLKLGFPLMYQTNILELLGLFARLGIRDARLEDALAILRGKRQSDGRWLLENTLSDRMIVHFGAKGKPSKWITLKALCVLKDL